jgi:hypothetical protein
MFPNALALEGVLSFDNIGTSILTVCMVILRVHAPPHIHCAPKLPSGVGVESFTTAFFTIPFSQSRKQIAFRMPVPAALEALKS